jgi:hypothetical protein
MNIVINAYGNELRQEVLDGLPKIVRLVIEEIDLHPGDTEVLADAVISDLDGTLARLGVASFSLDELAERYPDLGLAW